jgi:hypothetical protein
MWLIFGLVVGAGLVALILWLRSREIAVTWYEWLIGILGLLLVLFTLQNFIASFAEHEEVAAWTFLWIFGVPAVVLLAIASLLPWLRYRKTKSS